MNRSDINKMRLNNFSRTVIHDLKPVIALLNKKQVDKALRKINNLLQKLEKIEEATHGP